jgi:ketosteroid isomerase-like protein
MSDDPRIQLAHDLFAAWSSGDADAPEPFLHPDAVLADIVGGTHTGWPAIRAFFAVGLQQFPDLTLIPEKYWTSDDGVALSWTMSATVDAASSARFGAEHIGQRWSSPGMTYLEIVDGKVTREVDYHDSGAPVASLRR